MKRLLFILMILFLAASLKAQVKKPASKLKTTKTNKETESSAGSGRTTAKGGKSVILMSDGKCQFNGNAPNVPAYGADSPELDERVAGNSILRIRSELVYPSGAAKPVAGARMYLMDKSIDDILTETKWAGDGKSRPSFTLALQCLSGGNNLQTAFDAIQAHIKADFTTDSQGKAVLNNITKGRYFIFGIYKTPRGAAAWNVPIEVNEDSIDVTLNRSNAYYVK